MKTSRTKLLALALAGALPFAGCRSRPTASPPPESASLMTTDGAIAIGNLAVQIAGEERRLATAPASVPVLASLVELLLTRAQVLGQVGDYDRADAYAERAAAVPGAGSPGLLVRAGARAALHRFADALADLSEAEHHGADRMAVILRRASILHAQGQTEEALALRREVVAARPGLTTLGQLAISEAARGDAANAERHFDEALRAYRDTSPFPVAWIEFQRGLAAENAGRLDEAARQYGAAVARLPQYAEATGHLAGVEQLRGHLDRAEALLRSLVRPAIDPQYTAQLATVVDARDAHGEAARVRADARSRYDRLLVRHPEAYADHAARFLIGVDPPRALALARTNLAVRQTWDAYDLALWAAQAASASDVGCRIATEALSRRSPPQRIMFAASRALERCKGAAVARGGTGGPARP
jgi:tetratricopeptide (TPR) repeat protein